jgi:hypothetical protein
MPNAGERRSPPLWSIDDTRRASIVRDCTGQALGYFYFEDEPQRRSAAKLLNRDERNQNATKVERSQTAN